MLLHLKQGRTKVRVSLPMLGEGELVLPSQQDFDLTLEVLGLGELSHLDCTGHPVGV